MKKQSPGKIFIALDIGTSKVVTIVADAVDESDIEVLGIGRSASRGMKKGLVVNVEELSEAIGKSVSEAEAMANHDIVRAFVGISGAHIRGVSSHGLASDRRRKISARDVSRAIETAKQLFQSDHRLLHAIPQEYIVDGMGGIRDPRGMSGVRLEAKVHLITCAISALQNIEHCLQRCGVEAEQIILEQLASSCAVLSEDEQELGVCLIDIGGGTTDIAVFREGSIQYTAVIPIAGDHVTNDIAVGLRTPTRYAEDLKCKYGSANLRDPANNENIEVPGVGDRPPRMMSRQTLVDIIHSRYEELFEMVSAHLQDRGYSTEKMVSGVVLSGGGALVPGVVELAEEIFHTQVRRGSPQGIRGFEDMLQSPEHATSVGLLRYGLQRLNDEVEAEAEGFFPRLWQRLRGGF